MDPVNILIVDDHPEQLLALEIILGGLGQRVVKAGSGREALRQLLAQHFAVMLLDVQMPDMDGFETAKLVREREDTRSIPIIFVTADLPNDAQIFKGYAVGAVDYIIKPINPEILRSKVAVFVELAQQRERLAAAHAELMDAHKSLRKANEDLTIANEDLKSFSYSVSHDLRTPLRGLAGFADMLLKDYGGRLDDTGRDYARRMLGAAKQLDALTQDLLAYSQVSRAEVPLEPVKLGAVFQEVLEQFQADIRAKEARMTLPAELPEVLGQRSVLVQVMGNLVGNAIKFMAPGVNPRVTIRTEDKDPWVRVWVEDNGIGIESAYQEQVFRPFERLHGLQQYPGTGIGLAIVRKGVERMGGRVGVISAPAQGSRFWVELEKHEE